MLVSLVRDLPSIPKYQDTQIVVAKDRQGFALVGIVDAKTEKRKECRTFIPDNPIAAHSKRQYTKNAL